MQKELIVIILGSGEYTLDYAEFCRQLEPPTKILVVDKYKAPLSALPENAQYLAITSKNPLAKIVSFCLQNRVSVKAVINRVDYLELLHGQLVDTFNVPGPSAQAIDHLSDKAKMHSTVVQADLSFFRPRTIITTLNEAKSYLQQLQFPLVLKAHTGAKSRGVVMLKSPEDFFEARQILEKIIKDHDHEQILIEQFLYGKQVAPVMYVDSQGKVHILALADIVQAYETKQNHLQLIYRTTPSAHPEAIRQKITYVMQTLVDKTGLKSTMIHPDFFVIGKHVYLIEVNVRIAGFRTKMMQYAYNVNLNQMSWELALGLNVSDMIRAHSSCTMCEVWEEKSGIISSIKLPKSKHLVESKIIVQPGEKYVAPPKAQKPLAQFFVKSQDESLSIAKSLRKKTLITYR